MATTLLKAPASKLILTDLLVFALVYLIPALSHLAPFPLYVLDPMRLLLFTGYLLSRDKVNSYFLAATIPLFSMLVTGHPPFYKSFLISFELCSNIYLFFVIKDKLKSSFPVAIFSSMLLSKVLYYALKYLFISFALIEGALITTNLWIQLLTMLVISIVFSLVFRKIEGNEQTTD